jgi:hypothetical protein
MFEGKIFALANRPHDGNRHVVQCQVSMNVNGETSPRRETSGHGRLRASQ